MEKDGEILYWDDTLSDHGGEFHEGSMLVASGDGTQRWVMDVEFASGVDVADLKRRILDALQR